MPDWSRTVGRCAPRVTALAIGVWMTWSVGTAAMSRVEYAARWALQILGQLLVADADAVAEQELHHAALDGQLEQLLDQGVEEGQAVQHRALPCRAPAPGAALPP